MASFFAHGNGYLFLGGGGGGGGKGKNKKNQSFLNKFSLKKLYLRNERYEGGKINKIL